MSIDGRAHVLATSGGFRPSERGVFLWQRGPLVEEALRLSGVDRPRVCYVGTATGDHPLGVQGFYNAFASRGDAVPSHLSLFPMPNVEDPRRHLLGQHMVWVGGGSVANLLALWRLHGVDDAFREAWQSGVVLAGVSAGSICWHAGGTTDSFGPDLRPVTDGLALLRFGNGVHYDSDPQRRPLLHRLVAAGTLPSSYASDDGVGLHYVGTELLEAVADRPGAAAYLVERAPDGDAVETRIEPRLLADTDVP